MNFPFFNRLQIKKIVVAKPGDAGHRAEAMLAKLLQELPELLLAYVVENQNGTILASYTASSSYNPNQLSLRNTKLLRTINEALATGAWLGGPLLDISVLLDDQLHHVRPAVDGQWHCFVAVRLADANLGILKEVVRRATS
ncbi:hypothetical protein GKZ68_12120 [Hymenobacter sp. BRD128]|uniref:hypothetical protein n=1 Tax=Hymenobacter sp. BRD128 TaxID=2675878 RepID=UPI001566D422|nr:hypothetical protein [Hymenobacter sp. BRD128]QKG57300.1 hypothetical protein GKZ68_12120 [Hymenobacter sp. BRD128]